MKLCGDNEVIRNDDQVETCSTTMDNGKSCKREAEYDTRLLPLQQADVKDLKTRYRKQLLTAKRCSPKGWLTAVRMRALPTE